MRKDEEQGQPAENTLAGLMIQCADLFAIAKLAKALYVTLGSNLPHCRTFRCCMLRWNTGCRVCAIENERIFFEVQTPK